MLKRNLVLEEETALFILVSFGDVLLTGLVFYFGGVEANPAAAWVLHRFGLRALVFYKFALVTFVIIACQLIHTAHPRLARYVLMGGSIMLAALMLYSVGILLSYALAG